MTRRLLLALVVGLATGASGQTILPPGQYVVPEPPASAGGTHTCVATPAWESATRVECRPVAAQVPPPVTRTLTLTVMGSGLTTPPAGVSTFEDGAGVTLAGVPADGWTGPAWSGDPDCADGTLTMTADRACLATFTANPLPPDPGEPIPPPAPPSPDFAAKRWTLRPTDTFRGPDGVSPEDPRWSLGRALGAAGKHYRTVYHPPSGRLLIHGGDHNGSYQPDGVSKPYALQSGRQEMYWYDVGRNIAVIEQHYCRADNGLQPHGPDEMGFVWDSTRSKFLHLWGFQWWPNRNDCPVPANVFRGPATYDPATKQWAPFTPPTPTWGGSSVPNQCIFDPPSDEIVCFSKDGAGNPRAYRYHVGTNTFLPGVSGPSLGNVPISDSLPTYDPVGRIAYVVVPATRTLLAYDVAARTIRYLPIPFLPTVPGQETMPVWDTVNGVLLYPHRDPNNVITLVSYDPRTGAWALEPMPTGHVVHGNQAVFVPDQNVLLVFSGTSGVPGVGVPFQFYRYAERP